MSKVQVNTLQSLEQPEKVVDVRDLSDIKTTVQEYSAKIETDEGLIFESLRRSYAEAGYNLVDGSFEEGGTLTSVSDVLLHKASGIAYSWGGALPITIATNSTPTPLGSGGWIDQRDATLRSAVTAHEAKAGAHAITGVLGLGSELNSITQSIIAIQKLAASLEASPYRNKIVDGRFDFWYEGTTQTSYGYGSDTMWRNENTGSTKTHLLQALNPAADLPAIHVPSAKYFSRTVVSSVAGASNYVAKITKIENVRTLADKKATLSFYAKANAAKNIAIELSQRFGTGGTPSDDVVGIGSQLVLLSSSWTRYSIQIDVPSVKEKALGTNADDCLVLTFWFDAGSTFLGRAAGLEHQSGTFDIACVQLEEGEQATKFEELPMSISETLVGRYYETNYPYGTPVGTPNAPGGYREFTHPKATGTVAGAATQFRVPKRVIPAVSIFNRVTGAKDRVYSGGSLIEVISIGTVGKNGFASMNVTTLVANSDVSFYYVAAARL